VAIFRVQPTDGEKRLKTDLKAQNEDLAQRRRQMVRRGWHVVEVSEIGGLASLRRRLKHAIDLKK
jgi:hypothetical protein